MEIDFIEIEHRENVLKLMEICGMDLKEAYELYVECGNNFEVHPISPRQLSIATSIQSRPRGHMTPTHMTLTLKHSKNLHTSLQKRIILHLSEETPSLMRKTSKWWSIESSNSRESLLIRNTPSRPTKGFLIAYVQFCLCSAKILQRDRREPLQERPGKVSRYADKHQNRAHLPQ